MPERMGKPDGFMELARLHCRSTVVTAGSSVLNAEWDQYGIRHSVTKKAYGRKPPLTRSCAQSG